MGNFRNLVAIVTGGARGIGAATALKLAKGGAKVAIFDRNTETAEETLAKIKDAGSEGIALEVDVTNRQQIEKEMETVVDQWGKIDILVNNAGILKDSMIDNLSEEDWEQVIDVNLKGSFLCAQAAQKYMKKQNYGKIVMVSSQAAVGSLGRVNYSSAKAGVQGMTKALSMELGPFGINVNAVAPGFIDTDMSEVSRISAKMRGIDDFDEFKKSFIKNNPIQRVGRPEDVANVITFLASDEAEYVTGQVIYVSGRPVI
ncbi:beta-ketoacyl-ACP reductase [Pueribacillus theae]|uniref:Beta-ketoacyl-ACP reductase n=1 Tax=Pueribacillus theae TaxID=2171751 RepID=A0A2U1JRK2_9BACI|nr:SDR family NAD(P)-dependent oxidoreductase [Pueribacillus theae]PWA07826.1 beta-ketoacyl-ACP reductase [Pueribacillus theae]